MEVAKKILNLVKNGENYNLEDELEFIEDRPYNDKRYYISNEKLKKLGWSQSVNFDQGLSLLI